MIKCRRGRSEARFTDRNDHEDAAVVPAALSPHSALAWGPEGRALVGKIADQLLAGTPTGAKVDAILGTYKLEDAAKWPG